MPDISQIESLIGPKARNLILVSVGFLGNLIWAQFRARRIVLSWTANFQQITPESSNPTLSKVQVLLDDKPCKNLSSCQITLRNESTHDVDDFDLLFTFQNSFLVLQHQGSISTSAKALLLSQGFIKTTQEIQNTPEPKRNEHASFTYVIRNREFHLSALNRGTAATFTFLINSDDAAQKPTVIVTTEKKGVRLLLQPPHPRLSDVPLGSAVLWGLVLAAIVVYSISHLAIKPTLLAFISFAVGSVSCVFGIALIRLLRVLKRLFG